MSASPSIAPVDAHRPVVEQLRERVAALETSPAPQILPTLPAVGSLLPLHAGDTYGVDSATLALALTAGASRAGEWVGFAGWPDFGAEAAAELGVELSRTVLVPDPAEHWLEVTAALVDVLRVVVLRPPEGVDNRAARVLDARLRSRSSVLVVWGEWPRCDARLTLEGSTWLGPEAGDGRLRRRQARLVVQRGTAPAVGVEVAWTGDGLVIDTTPSAVPRAASG